jgi:ribosomal protein L11 methyltransferase
MKTPTNAQASNTSAPLQIGRRFVVAPTGVDVPITPGRMVMRIDAGAVFGSGAHPTTQLCLAALDRHLPPATPVADIGTGAGILSIAAALLGAGPILAVDTDAEAVRVAQANVVTNGVDKQVHVMHGSLADVLAVNWGEQPRAWVVANILAKVLEEMFEHGLAQAVGSGGWLILSGVLHAQTPMLRAHLNRAGLELLAQEHLGEWVCLLARRPCR